MTFTNLRCQMNCTMMTPSLPSNMLKQVIVSETTQLVAHACTTSPQQAFIGAFGCIQIEVHINDSRDILRAQLRIE